MTIFAPLQPDRPAISPATALVAALSAAAVTVTHAIGLGLLAFAPLAGYFSIGAMVLWSAALPGLVLNLLLPRKGIVYAPSTVTALLFGAVAVAVSGAAGKLGMNGAQVMAACGATMALAFIFQWLFGVLRLASLARFLPISVAHGFAAGVGLSLVLSQFRNGFGTGGWGWDQRLAVHALVALAVVLLSIWLQQRYKKLPGLLLAMLVVSILVTAFGDIWQLTPAIGTSVFALPPLPDWRGVPWLRLVREQGAVLLPLAVLMALINSLEIVIFNQELELEHGLRSNPNLSLRRESLVSALCGLCGFIPASTSSTRSRGVLNQVGPNSHAPILHALVMMVVAVTGMLWLPWVPMACLAGGLVRAGMRQVPIVMWSRAYARAAPETWAQSWLVGLVFAIVGGLGALLVGLVVATVVLLRTSAGSVLRRVMLDGQLRSRRLRRAGSDAWLVPRMKRTAVFELQGVLSFGVAAHLAEQVRILVQPNHDRVLLDASRVPAWDDTALVQIRALARDLARRGAEVAVCALQVRERTQLQSQVRVFADLDRGLQWAEDSLLAERPEAERSGSTENGELGEIGEKLQDDARLALIKLLREQQVQAGEQLFSTGDVENDLIIVQRGLITLVTSWPPDSGMRLTTVGRGTVFGEIAFLTGQHRTACAGAEDAPAKLQRLARADFDSWAELYAKDALQFMANLAIIGTRRLGATTRQLRAVLE